MTNSTQYQLTTVPFTNVTFNDAFWAPRLETNRTVTLPYNFKKCEETGRISNFTKAAGLIEGEHEGIFFNDSDVFKVVEGAAYSLTIHPDPELDAYLDKLIAQFAAAQEEDGYLYTARTIAERNGAVDQLPPDREGQTRWSNLRINHELYNVGHLYEAAVAHFHATGKRSLLDIALKNADLIDQVFGPNGQRDVPGHQEIEMGLVKLYQVTGEQRYLDLAKFFLDERGHPNNRELYTSEGNFGYMQDHKPVVEQDEAVGHSVRAGYMYCGMADVAALVGEAAYITAIDRIWQNVVNYKLYLTGGIDARHQGEAFGENYELPNDVAYTETCAAIANAMWNWRMFLLHKDAAYIDVLERTIYNGFLSGVSLSGDRFFYSNPLSFDGKFVFNRDNSTTRQPWFSCSCCPTNVVRFVPSLPGYVYALGEEQSKTPNIYINLYVTSQATIHVNDNRMIISQETNYPWDGKIHISLQLEEPTDLTLMLPIPGWARNQPVPSDLYDYLDKHSPAAQKEPTLTVNGESIALKLEDGYVAVQRRWDSSDRLVLNLPMPVRRVGSNASIEPNRGRVALERGPLIYCFEAIDNGGSALDLTIPDNLDFRPIYQPQLLNGVTILQTEDKMLTAIPYYAWAHRDVGEMAVWLPTM
ncbi:glycoside hydrolase family 127 protein [Chloroflexi bacterium TSY]|nr:glycoside hydrolase family 127 protein [Chloroflexi bacterium TSY]